LKFVAGDGKRTFGSGGRSAVDIEHRFDQAAIRGDAAVYLSGRVGGAVPAPHAGLREQKPQIGIPMGEPGYCAHGGPAFRTLVRAITVKRARCPFCAAMSRPGYGTARLWHGSAMARSGQWHGPVSGVVRPG
jgi:hypothetical protein